METGRGVTQAPESQESALQRMTRQRGLGWLGDALEEAFGDFTLVSMEVGDGEGSPAVAHVTVGLTEVTGDDGRGQ